MLATFIGNFFAGNICDGIGRKRALILAAVLFSFCTIGSALSRSYAFFLASRFIGGFGIGISLLVVPLYISEIAPASRRGFLVSFNQLNVGLGYLLAYLGNTVVNAMVQDPDMKWRWMLGIGFIFPLVYLSGLLFIPESPAWLAFHGKYDIAGELGYQCDLSSGIKAHGIEMGPDLARSRKSLYGIAASVCTHIYRHQYLTSVSFF